MLPRVEERDWIPRWMKPWRHLNLQGGRHLDVCRRLSLYVGDWPPSSTTGVPVCPQSASIAPAASPRPLSCRSRAPGVGLAVPLHTPPRSDPPLPMPKILTPVRPDPQSLAFHLTVAAESLPRPATPQPHWTAPLHPGQIHRCGAPQQPTISHDDRRAPSASNTTRSSKGPFRVVPSTPTRLSA
jgi:hypothetical protein